MKSETNKLTWALGAGRIRSKHHRDRERERPTKTRWDEAGNNIKLWEWIYECNRLVDDFLLRRWPNTHTHILETIRHWPSLAFLSYYVQFARISAKTEIDWITNWSEREFRCQWNGRDGDDEERQFEIDKLVNTASSNIFFIRWHLFCAFPMKAICTTKH